MGPGPVGPSPEQGCAVVDHLHWTDGYDQAGEPLDQAWFNNDFSSKYIGPSAGSLYLRNNPMAGYVPVLCADKYAGLPNGDRSIFSENGQWVQHKRVQGAVDRLLPIEQPNPADPTGFTQSVVSRHECPVPTFGLFFL